MIIFYFWWMVFEIPNSQVLDIIEKYVTILTIKRISFNNPVCPMLGYRKLFQFYHFFSFQSFDCHMNINSRFCVPNGAKLYVFLNLVEGKSIRTSMFKFRVTAERVDGMFVFFNKVTVVARYFLFVCLSSSKKFSRHYRWWGCRFRPMLVASGF
jgi:hypothetical protein